MEKILIVGGTFDNNGGKKSSLIEKLFGNRKDIVLINGGSWEKFKNGYETYSSIYGHYLPKFKVIGWFPNIPNSEEKIRDIKSINPHCLLIMSKRNNGQYEFKELIKRALDQKANLTIEFSKTSEDIFNMRLFDPLGNVYSNTTDANKLYEDLMNRVKYLLKTIRINSQQVFEDKSIPYETEELEKFFDIVRTSADTFFDLLNPAPTTRFLGNASFNTRCLRGFPSFKSYDKQVFVSQRNIDKQFISPENFVPVELYERSKSVVLFDGPNKPSVDTAVQISIYKQLPNIKYMIHGHVYVEGAPFTDEVIPCGDLREVPAILNTLVDEIEKSNNLNSIKLNHTSILEKINCFAINLRGHGCIIAASSPEQLKQFKFIARPMPEINN